MSDFRTEQFFDFLKGRQSIFDDIMQDLERQFPGMRERLVDEKGELRRFINLYVNEEDVRFLQGRTTGLKDGADVIMPAYKREIPADDDRWKVVLFVRTLPNPPSPAP